MSPTANAPTLNNFSPELNKLLEEVMPQEEGEVLIFERIHRATPMDALNEENQAVQYNAVPGPYRIPRRETIIDPGTGRPIVIANVAGESPNGAGIMEAVIPEVTFQPGLGHRIQVGADDPVLLARLLLSDKNKDSINPRKRTPDGGHVWQLVKPAAEAEDAYERAMLAADALSAVRALENDPEALALVVEKLSLPTVDRGRKFTAKEQLAKLATLANNSPETVTNAVAAGEMKLEQLIGKAEKLGVIDFVEANNEWVWKATQEPITHAVVGYKPAEALVRYIQNNPAGLKFSQMLSGRVKAEEKKAAK